MEQQGEMATEHSGEKDIAGGDLTVESTMARSYACKDCNYFLDPSVLVCPNCKSYQNWRRYLHLGQGLIILASAIVSAILAIATGVIHWQTQKPETLDAHVMNLSLKGYLDFSKGEKDKTTDHFTFFAVPLKGSLSVTVENNTEKDGFIVALVVEVVSDNHKSHMTFLDTRSVSPVVKAGSLASLRFDSQTILLPGLDQQPLSLARLGKANVHLLVKTRVAGGVENIERLPVSWDQIGVQLPLPASLSGAFEIDAEEQLTLLVKNTGGTDAVKVMALWGYVPYGLINDNNDDGESNPSPGFVEPSNQSDNDEVMLKTLPAKKISVDGSIRFLLGSIKDQREELDASLRKFGRVKLRVWLVYEMYPGEQKSFIKDQSDVAEELVRRLLLTKR